MEAKGARFLEVAGAVLEARAVREGRVVAARAAAAACFRKRRRLAG